MGRPRSTSVATDDNQSEVEVAAKMEPEVAPGGGVTWVEIRIPLAAPPEGTYIATQIGHVTASLNRHTELPGFRDFHAGLRAINAVMGDGKPVSSASDVFRWVAQQLTASKGATASN